MAEGKHTGLQDFPLSIMWSTEDAEDTEALSPSHQETEAAGTLHHVDLRTLHI